MQSLLVLNLTPELEEDLVDFLLAREEVEGFTSFELRGHGEHENLSVAEQVSGRRRRLQFEIRLQREAVDALLDALGREVGHDIRFRELPILRSGIAGGGAGGAEIGSRKQRQGGSR